MLAPGQASRVIFNLSKGCAGGVWQEQKEGVWCLHRHGLLPAVILEPFVTVLAPNALCPGGS